MNISKTDFLALQSANYDRLEKAEKKAAKLARKLFALRASGVGVIVMGGAVRVSLKDSPELSRINRHAKTT